MCSSDMQHRLLLSIHGMTRYGPERPRFRTLQANHVSWRPSDSGLEMYRVESAVRPHTSPNHGHGHAHGHGHNHSQDYSHGLEHGEGQEPGASESGQAQVRGQY